MLDNITDTEKKLCSLYMFGRDVNQTFGEEVLVVDSLCSSQKKLRYQPVELQNRNSQYITKSYKTHNIVQSTSQTFATCLEVTYP